MPARPRPDSSANNWWERSPHSSNGNNFCAVNSDGTANNNNANNNNGLAPFGCASLAAPSSESESGGGIEREMQGDATSGGDAPNSSRHAVEACTHRLSQGGSIARLEDVFTYGHLYEAGVACCSGVRWKASTQSFESRLLSEAARAHAAILDGTWRPGGFTEFDIVERGKARHIQACRISERMVQKCLVRECLRPLVLPRLIYDSHATIPGHGVEFALSRLRGHLRWHYARHGLEGHVVVMDYHDYFGSIDHDRLKAMYARLPMDARLLSLTCMLIDQFDGSRGLGLGSEISQLSAVLYVSPIDHLAKDRLGVHCYGRYMDDSYAVLPTKPEAEAFLAAVEEKSDELGLALNPRATKVVPLRQGFSYLKKRIRLTPSGRVAMRPQRDNVVRESRRLRRNAQAVAEGRMTPEAERQSFESWKSHLLKLDAHRTVRAMEAYRDRLLPESRHTPVAATVHTSK